MSACLMQMVTIRRGNGLASNDLIHFVLYLYTPHLPFLSHSHLLFLHLRLAFDCFDIPGKGSK